jgi:hypothetical protein
MGDNQIHSSEHSERYNYKCATRYSEQSEQECAHDRQPNRSTLVRRANVVRSALARSEDNILCEHSDTIIYGRSIIMIRAKAKPRPTKNMSL